MKLSIIIPYYKCLEYTKRLFEVLEPQIDENVEIIIVDDGCNEKELEKLNAKVIHLKENSGGASKPRNVGLDNATGDYITFIDADDLVSNDYIYHIKRKMAKNPDIIYLSWKSHLKSVLITSKPTKRNCSVWCRVYKRKIIGDIRFREDLREAEDWFFNLDVKPNTSLCIKEYVYFYNNGRPGSITTGGEPE